MYVMNGLDAHKQERANCFDIFRRKIPKIPSLIQINTNKQRDHS